MGQKTPNSSMNQAEGQKSILNWLMECLSQQTLYPLNRHLYWQHNNSSYNTKSCQKVN